MRDRNRRTGHPGRLRDMVGRSGVYPMSGPLPKGDAPLRGQMEWGQGFRGARGYEDHGASELILEGESVVGGLDPEWAGIFEEISSSAATRTLEIPLHCWAIFCEWFTLHHQGIVTTATAVDRETGASCEARYAPLEKMAAHILENGVAAISIQLHRHPSDSLLNITQPRQMIYSTTSSGSPESLRIVHARGSVLLWFGQVQENGAEREGESAEL